MRNHTTYGRRRESWWERSGLFGMPNGFLVLCSILLTVFIGGMIYAESNDCDGCPPRLEQVECVNR